MQRSHAAIRGIDWHLTWEQWLEWWGSDITKRGSMGNNLCMCRYGDKGSYSIDNIYKDTRANNSRVADKSYATRHLKKHNRSVTVGTTVYESINACARAYNISNTTATRRCNTNNFPEWQFTQ